MKRKIHPREIVLRVFPILKDRSGAEIKIDEVHVYRMGIATGAAIPACVRAEFLLNVRAGYWQYAAHSWIIDKAPICVECRQVLVQEGLVKE